MNNNLLKMLGKEVVFNINRLADEYEAKAKAYRDVANDLMNGSGHEAKPKRKASKLKGHKYNGTHWTQDPKRKRDVIAMARKGAKTRLANR